MPIRAWQIWNEPNLENYFSPRPSAKKYAQLLKIAHGAITSQDRGATIVLAGMPGYGKPRAWKFLSQLYHISGIKRDFDATALHPYARSLSQLKAEVTRVRQVMKKHGDGNTSLWFTELGWGSGHPDKFGLNKGLKGQKRLLSQSFKLILNRRASWHVQRVFWFDWRDPGRNSNAAGTCSFCRSAGLLRHNRHPKPAWRAFKRFSAG
jgi:hypothetical protein